MGFSKPKDLPPPTPAPPPVRQTGAEVLAASDEARRRMAMRKGYDSTINVGTLLGAAAPMAETKKTLLGQ